MVRLEKIADEFKNVQLDRSSLTFGYKQIGYSKQLSRFNKTIKVRFEVDKPVAVEGNLIIKGVTKASTLSIDPFQLMPHPMLKKDALGNNAKIKRTDFNAGKYAPYVGDEVTLDIAVEAIKE